MSLLSSTHALDMNHNSVNVHIWTEAEQLEHAADLVLDGSFTRWDTRFSSVWLTRDERLIPVSQMSTEHMCATIALWLRKEFSDAMTLRLVADNYPEEKANPYLSFEQWMSHSEAMLKTAALPTMLERLQCLPGGMDMLRVFTHDAAHAVQQEYEPGIEHTLSLRPVFF